MFFITTFAHTYAEYFYVKSLYCSIRIVAELAQLVEQLIRNE